MRVQIVKSKNATSLYIIKSIRINNKNTSKVVEKLGSLSSLMTKFNMTETEVLAWAGEKAKLLTDDDKKNQTNVMLPLSQSQLIIPNHSRLFNVGYLFLQDIYYDLGLHTICNHINEKYKFEYDLNNILSNLIYTRILYPSSKKASLDHATKFIEQPKHDLHQIYRSLEVIAKEKDFIESQLYENSKSVITRNTSVLYYDCTNFFFEIHEAEDDKQYGKSKENRANPIVQMGLFLDGNGLPLAFCITPGNKNEQTTLRPLEERIINDFKNVKQFVVCTDAGLNSNANRKFNNINNRAFIVTESLKKQPSHIKERVFSKENWFYFNKENKQTKAIFDPTVYTRESIYNINENITKESNKITASTIFFKELFTNEKIEEQRIIITFSLCYKEYACNVRNKQIERASVKIESNSKYSKKVSQNNPDRFIKELNITENGEVASEKTLYMDKERIKEESKYDGLYAVSTTLLDDVREIIKVTHRRWEIEESFRIMKSEFKSRPVFVKNSDRIVAHFVTCYLSLMIYRILEKKLNEEYTVHEILAKLKEMTCLEVEGEGYIPTYTRNKLTDDLHEIFKLRTDTQIVSMRNIKKYIRQTKK